MTTIAYRNGTIAADSRTTLETEGGGARMFLCEKLFRKTVTLKDGKTQEVIIATAGESTPGMVFLDWFWSGQEPPERLIDGEADFTCLVLQEDGLFEYDAWCRGIQILDEFYAIGSGAKAALAAMYMGASAAKAVEIACRIDFYSGPPITTMRLRNAKLQVPKMRRGPSQRKQSPKREAAVGVHSPLGGREDILLLNNEPGRNDGAGQKR